MNAKAQITRLIVASGILTGVAGMAAGPIESPSLEASPMILKEYDRIYIDRPLAGDFAVMNVRVFGPDNELLLSTRTAGEPVEFLVGSDLADGVYRYETVSIFGNVDLSKSKDERAATDGDTTMLREFGTFRVSNGSIIEDIRPGEEGDSSSSLLDMLLDKSVNMAGIVLDVLVPSAQAANVLVESATPQVAFNDTDVAGDEWNVWGFSNSWGIADVLGGNNHWVFRIDGTPDVTTNVNSMIVDPDGDIHWGSNSLNFDRDLSALSLGTSAVRRDVTIASLDPAIDLFDETFSDSMGVNYNGINFSIYNNAGVDAVLVGFSAPGNSLVVNNSGNVGIGTSSPAATLNVASGNTAKIQVNNTTVAAPAGDQVMFQLQSAATNKVRFVIGNDNALWTFDNAGGSFQVNLAGTGVNEFRVESDGDAVILKNSFALNHINTSSRESKTDFAPVDEIAVLEKLSELPMSTWRYKKETADQRHLGPVAEDFQEAFGLSDGEHISTIDSSGVALTAIKGLNKVLKERTAEIAELTRANSELQKTNAELVSANQAMDDRLTRLELLLLQQDEVALR